MTFETKRDRRFANTLAKGLKVLQAFSPRDHTLGNSELARRTDMPPSTIARMTYTLTRLGFLQQSAQDDSYRLGPAVMALGYTARAGLTYLPIAEPIMKDLAEEMGALVALAIRDGEYVMLTRCWRPAKTPSIWLSEGHRLSVRISSAGRAIRVASGEKPSDTGSLEKDLAALQSCGFVSSVGHWNPDINACAVPFLPDPSRDPVAFLCGANAGQMSKQRIRESVGPGLLASVRKLEQAIGIPNLQV